jgi:multisubunit Na+/H+ antiporter MnhC subunit
MPVGFLRRGRGREGQNGRERQGEGADHCPTLRLAIGLIKINVRAQRQRYWESRSNLRETAMPFDSIIVITAVVIAFFAFGLTLAWAHRQAH